MITLMSLIRSLRCCLTFNFNLFKHSFMELVVMMEFWGIFLGSLMEWDADVSRSLREAVVHTGAVPPSVGTLRVGLWLMVCGFSSVVSPFHLLWGCCE